MSLFWYRRVRTGRIWVTAETTYKLHWAQDWAYLALFTLNATEKTSYVICHILLGPLPENFCSLFSLLQHKHATCFSEWTPQKDKAMNQICTSRKYSSSDRCLCYYVILSSNNIIADNVKQINFCNLLHGGKRKKGRGRGGRKRKGRGYYSLKLPWRI